MSKTARDFDQGIGLNGSMKKRMVAMFICVPAGLTRRATAEHNMSRAPVAPFSLRGGK